MNLPILCLCLALTGCCTDQIVHKAPVFDARLMEECASLQDAKISSFSDVLEAKASDVKVYTECKNIHGGLVMSIKEYQKEFNK